MHVASELWQPCSRRISQESRIRWKGAISRNQEKKEVQKGYWISYTVGGNVSWRSHCENTIEVPQFSSVQLFSCVWLLETPCSAARQASLSITDSRSLLKLMSHQVGEAIQPSHPLSSPAPPAFNLPQHLGLFYWIGSLHQVAKVLELQLQHQPCQWIFRVDFL